MFPALPYRLIAIVVGVAAVFIGAYAFAVHYGALLKDNATLKIAVTEAAQQQEGWKKEVEYLAAERERLDAAVRGRDADLATIKAKRRRLNVELVQMEKIPEVKSWLDAPIPAPIRSALLRGSGTDRGDSAGAGNPVDDRVRGAAGVDQAGRGDSRPAAEQLNGPDARSAADGGK